MHVQTKKTNELDTEKADVKNGVKNVESEACRGKFMKHADRHCQREGLDLLLDFPQHLRSGLPPTTGEMRCPHRHHPNIADRHTNTENRHVLSDRILSWRPHIRKPQRPAVHDTFKGQKCQQ